MALQFTGNRNAKMSSVVAIDWDNVVDRPGIVQYDIDQGLDGTQREQARENIAAVGYDAQTLTDEQKAQARDNIGSPKAPMSTFDNAIARFDGTDGKILQGSSVLVDDSGGILSVGPSGSAGHSLPQLVLRCNDNATPDGAGGFVRFQTINDAGVLLDSVQINAGLVDATAGSEQGLLDFGLYRDGVVEIITIDAASPAALFPGPNGTWDLGRTNNRWKDGYFSGTFNCARIAIAGGTVSTDNPPANITQTWNSGGTTFTAFKVNITNTASAAASKLIDLQLDGTTLFRVTRLGGGYIFGSLNICGGIAAPAGGSASAVATLGTTLGFGVYYGSGIPTVSGAQGSIYLRSDGRPYYNTNGTTGWSPLASTSGDLICTATNDNATAGQLGEYVSSAVAVGSAVALTTATAANITSISLTAGDWLVGGTARFTGGATTTVNQVTGSISNTSATLNETGSRSANLIYAGGTPFNYANPAFSVGPSRISLASTTTIYLVGFSVFATSTCSAFGEIWARRLR